MSSEKLSLGIGFEHQGTDKVTRDLKRQHRIFRQVVGVLGDVNEQSYKIKQGFGDIKDSTLGWMRDLRSSIPSLNRLLSPLERLSRGFKRLQGWSSMVGLDMQSIWQSGLKIQNKFTRIANVMGSDRVGLKMIQWQRDMLANFPILEDDLNDFMFQMNKFGLPPDLVNLKGILEAANGPAMDFNNALSAIIATAEGGDVRQLQESLNFKIGLDDIQKSLSGITTVQDRIVALSDLFEKKFSGGVQRESRKVESSIFFMRNMFNEFRETIVGEPIQGGFMFEVQGMMKDMADWFRDNRTTVMKFARTLSRVLGQAIRALRIAMDPLIKRFKDFFVNSDEAVDRFQKVANKAVLLLALVGRKLAWAFSHPQEAFDKLKNSVASWISDIDWGSYMKMGMGGLGSAMYDSLASVFFGSQGVTAGVVTGGLIGSLFGPVGTAIGATIGSAISRTKMGSSIFAWIVDALYSSINTMIEGINSLITKVNPLYKTVFNNRLKPIGQLNKLKRSRDLDGDGSQDSYLPKQYRGSMSFTPTDVQYGGGGRRSDMGGGMSQGSMLGGLSNTNDPVTKAWRDAGIEVKQYAGKMSELVNGGGVHKGLLPVAKYLDEEFARAGLGGIRVTAGNDKYHKTANPGSKHNKGMAFDVTPDMQGHAKDELSKKEIALMNEILKKAGKKYSGLSFLDEYTNPTKHSTGGHIHVEFRTMEALEKIAAAADKEKGGGHTFITNFRS